MIADGCREAVPHTRNTYPDCSDQSCRIEDEEELAGPLHLVYDSLWHCGSAMIADGHLLDILRRVHAFGLALLKMDLRQESTRHTELLAAVTKELDLGNYAAWPEDRKCEWLVRFSLTTKGYDHQTPRRASFEQCERLVRFSAS